MGKLSLHIPASLIVMLFLFTGCRASQQETTDSADLQIELDLSDTPTVGESTLQVLVNDADGDPVNDATVEIRGDMNHAGMLPELVSVEGGTDGVYELPFNWSMGGDWILTITATLPDGSETSEEFDVPNVTSGGDMAMDMDDAPMIMLETDPSPPTVNDTTLIIHLMDGDTTMRTDAPITVTGTVNDTDAEPVVVEIPEADEDGYYRATFPFSHADDWFLTVTATLDDGETISRDFDLFDVIMSFGSCAPANTDPDATEEAGDSEECSIEMPTQSPFSLPGG